MSVIAGALAVLLASAVGAVIGGFLIVLGIMCGLLDR